MHLKDLGRKKKMVKINSISVNGLRGVRHNLALRLKGRSALLYGDNGSGKSSLSDVLEWFFYDKIEHLSGEEIGRKGYEAMRNIFLDDEESGSLDLGFTKGYFDSEKTITLNNGNLKTKQSNSDDEFSQYLDASQEENLILRYKELATFVMSSKSDKLRALSEIIGYGKVTDTRDTLRKVFNRLSKEIKTKNFDNQINHQQGLIIEQLGRNVTSDEQFIEVVKELTKPFNLKTKVEVLKDINTILNKIKKPDDSKAVKQETFLVKIVDNLVNLPVNLDEIESQYSVYKGQFEAIVSDIEKLKKLTLEQLLATGENIVGNESYTDDNCPLCLEEKNKTELLTSIKTRIIELEGIKKEQKKLVESKNSLQHQITLTLRLLEPLLFDKQASDKTNKNHKTNIDAIIKGIKSYQELLKVKVVEGSKLTDKETIKVDRSIITTVQSDCNNQLSAIRKERKKDPKWYAHSKITIAGHAYMEIKKLLKEKATYEKQRNTLEVIYSSFLKKQKEALETFLETFSDKINEIYQFLNPGEKVENIKLIPIEKDNELAGITIQFDFFENQEVTPPHKFLSESHLNCLGLAFFLTSVDAFNKQNKFIVLDDVISSFDANHRKRFADLLIETYSDYQVIMLTHERNWFDLVKNLVRGKDWNIQTIKHNEAKGTYVDEAPQTLLERIESKFTNGDEAGLGNDTRIYLEHVLKQIAYNLEVKVAYRSNDVNEDRMAFELLTELKGTISKRKCTELKAEPVIDRLLSSLFIGNKDSHDSSFDPSFGDMKAFWQDVKDFEKLFFCDTCGYPVSVRFFYDGNKQISCKKGELTYTWKR